MFPTAVLALTLVTQTMPLEPKPERARTDVGAELQAALCPTPPERADAARDPASPSAKREGVDARSAGLAASAGLFVPGVASYTQGDYAGGALHTFWGLQGMAFFFPAMADIVGFDDWDTDRRYVALVSGAALMAVNYFASIVRAGRPAPTTGSPRDPLRVRVAVSTIVGGRGDSFSDYSNDLVPSVGQQLRVGVMIGPGIEAFVMGEATFGELYHGDDLGLSVGGGLTGYIPTGSAVSPYLGFGVAYHPESPVLTQRFGFAIELSPRVDLLVGGKTSITTDDEVNLGHLMGEIGFVQAF